MRIYDAIDATWPAAHLHRAGPWCVREGLGGGKRVSAASAAGAWSETDIPLAEAAHHHLGQTPLFMIRNGEGDLDAALAARGYAVIDPVTIYAAPVALLARDRPERATTFNLWPMLEIMREIWADGGIGPGRLAVMERAALPKTAILGRLNDRAAGVAFVGCHGDTAMLHALHVLEDHRRQGIAVKIMRAAAFWAQDIGADRFSLVVTDANTTARALYASLGMQVMGQYHYRVQKAR